jgi:hypothetical protein
MALDAAALLTGKYCLDKVSKDALVGRVVVHTADRETCHHPTCETLTLVQFLELDLSPAECDGDLGKALDGRMRVRNLATVFAGPRETLRGVHAGDFAWSVAGGGSIRGTLRGITNAGIVRPPVRPCEGCREVGILTGHLSGTGANVPGVPVPDFDIDAVYRLAWDPIAEVQKTASVVGTLEGVVIMPCR